MFQTMSHEGTPNSPSLSRDDYSRSCAAATVHFGPDLGSGGKFPFHAISRSRTAGAPRTVVQMERDTVDLQHETDALGCCWRAPAKRDLTAPPKEIIRVVGGSVEWIASVNERAIRTRTEDDEKQFHVLRLFRPQESLISPRVGLDRK